LPPPHAYPTRRSSDLFRHFVEQTRTLSGSLYGRRLYELMEYWDGDDWDQDRPSDLDDLRAFATAWRAVPKWVVSTTLTSVGPNRSEEHTSELQSRQKL